ncbi:MAG: hypothetical protein ABSB26_05950 [Nitrososphaerales archaeon]|jgi:hypothetical protein
MNGKSLYEEVWECRFPRRQTVEEDLLALQALAPVMVEDLYSLFKEAVTDSFVNILGGNEARALMRLIAGTSFGSPDEVYEVLDSIFHEGAQILRKAIVEEFSASVHLLLEKAEREATQFIGQSGESTPLYQTILDNSGTP